MAAPYLTVALEQGTSAWLDWRRLGIGASDAPAIMGENPWKSASALLADKSGAATGFEGNAAMARGTALEPEARRRFEDLRRIRVLPACLQSTTHEWQRASVDGISHDGSCVVEIKCGQSSYNKTSLTRSVPRYYVGQLQHILSVTGLGQMDFFCWLPGLPAVHLVVPRDDRYIARLLAAEQRFWGELLSRRR